MPQVLSQEQGGFQVQFDDGTVGFMPDYLASGLVGQGMGLTTPAPAPAPSQVPTGMPPDVPTGAPALPNAPADVLAPPESPGAQVGAQLAANPQLPPGISGLSVKGTAPVAPVPVSNKNFGLPGAISADQVLAPQLAAADERKQAIIAQGDAKAAASEAALPFLDREVAERESRSAAITQANEEAQTELAGYEKNIQDRLAAVPTADAQNLWHDTSTFGKIALAFGAFAAGFTGGASGASSFWNTIKGMVDQDIQAQFKNIDTAKEGVYRAERTQERGRQNIIDRMRTQHEAYLERLGSIQAGLKSEMAKYEAPLIKAQYQEALSKIDEEMAVHYKEAVQLAYTTALQTANAKSEQYHQRNMEALGWSREKREAAEFQLSLDAKKAATAKATEEAAGKDVVLDRATGNKWIIGTKTADRDEMIKNFSNDKTGIAGYANLTIGLKEYYAKANELGRTYGGPASRSAAVISRQQQLREELKGQRQQLIQEYQHNNFGAAFTENEQKVLEAALPPPDSITGPESANIVKSFISNKAKEAQRKFVNGLDLKHEDGSKVDLVKEWGTVAIPNIPKYLDAPELLESGEQVATGLGQLPRNDRGRADPKVAGDQVKMLVERSNEIINRAKNYASRSSMTPQVGAQAVEQLKGWAALLDSTGYTQQSDKVYAQALELENMMAKPAPVPLPDINIH